MSQTRRKDVAVDPRLVSVGPRGAPSGMADFVGRAEEIADIARLVEGSRMVTLTGPSGIGKTRLAIETALRLHDSYSGGTWFVDLAPVSDPELVPQVAASVLGLEAQPGRDPVDALCSYLEPQTALLVLDNCEHLVDACASLAERLGDDCNGVSVLATSQQELGLATEHTKVVASLSLPELSAPSIAQAQESEAIRLFCTRALAASAAFRLTEELIAPIAEICRRLDGIPLAIELAAARVAILSPAEIAERLDQRFRLLKSAGRATTPDRHQTLRAALDWSYDLLSDEEATLFRRLSVFAGGASLVAIEQVCSGDGVRAETVIDLLGSLVSKSLVGVDLRRSRARYHQLETIRAYAGQRLDEAGGRHAAASRHATWCVGWVEDSWQKVGQEDFKRWPAIVEADHDNVRAAMEWSIGADPAVGLRLASDLIPFWRTQGYLREGRQWLSRVLDALALPSAALAVAPPPVLRARALWGLGLLATLQGDVISARPAVEESVQVARDSGHVRAHAHGLNLLGFISIFTQDPLAAKSQLQESVDMGRTLDDPSLLATTLALLGRAHLFLSEIDEARRAFEECLALDREDPDGAIIGLGMTAVAAGEEDRASALFSEAQALLREGGERFETALVLSFVGELSWADGDIAGARAQLEEGLELARAMGAPYPLVRCLAGLASVAQAEGDTEAAARLVEEACEISSSAHLPYAQVRCLHVRGGVRAATGDAGGAEADYDEALSVARANRDRDGIARSLYRLAGAGRAKGAEDEALELLREALLGQAEVGNAGIPRTLESIAGLSARLGRPAHAAGLFGAAATLREAYGARRRPDERATYEADLAALRAGVEPDRLAQAWAEGAALSREEAVHLALSGPTGDEAAPSHGWSSLSPMERRVADLAAEGLSNAEIAQQLFVSDRTVQGHLARIFPKLGLSSRRQLRDARRERKN